MNQGALFILFGCAKTFIQSNLRILKYLKESKSKINSCFYVTFFVASHFKRHIFELEILSLPKLLCSSKICYCNTRNYFCMNSLLLNLKATLHLRKNSKCNLKGAYLSIKYDHSYVNIVSKFRFNLIKSLLQ